MMKIAIVSDTHGNSPAVVWIIEYLNREEIDVLFHAGDIGNPGILRRFANYYNGQVHFVFGNNDGEVNGLNQVTFKAQNLTGHGREAVVELNDRLIFMNHYTNVSKAMAKTGDYDICIGGHTHMYEAEEIDDTLFINPGNTVTKDKWLAHPKWENHSSIVILDLESMEHEKVLLPNSYGTV